MNKITITRLLMCGLLTTAAAAPLSIVNATPATQEPAPVQLPEPSPEQTKEASDSVKQQELFHGYWVNQRGSTLDIKEHEGLLSGYFTTAEGKTRSCIGVPVAITGSSNKNAMAISFSMGSCGSPATLAVTGLIMKDKNGNEQLRTQALIQFNGTESWDSQVLTTDFYTRQEPAKKPQ
ncbi:avidin/streptavidin family protein [Endozoicomonas lisbonensis]|uniref:DUF306 domain-containing protein n=2 Tax=Endozoicomonas lisbonensis TaxID=3120522 RepID=A0ABV2SH15_9GAMM